MRASLIPISGIALAIAATDLAYSQMAPAPFHISPFVDASPPLILSPLTSGMEPLGDAPRFTTDAPLIESLQEPPTDRSFVQVETVGEAGGQWLIVKFRDFNLGQYSTLEITSWKDGATQRFTQQTLSEWDGQSAIFNGERVNIVLNKAPGDADVRYEIESLIVGEEGASAGSAVRRRASAAENVEGPAPEAICGDVDDRVPGSEARVGRLMPVGCTGWNIGNELHLTAGHCVPGNQMLIFETNVPNSKPDGTTVSPNPSSDQFKVIQDSIAWDDEPIGNDWAVFRTSKNSLGETVHAKFGHFEISTDAQGDVIVSGFGLDSEPSGPTPPDFWNSDSQTRQTHQGSLTREGNVLKHKVDTRGGNSGSPIYLNSEPGTAVGIHTNAGCTSGAGANHGTSFANQDLMKAISSPK